MYELFMGLPANGTKLRNENLANNQNPNTLLFCHFSQEFNDIIKPLDLEKEKVFLLFY